MSDGPQIDIGALNFARGIGGGPKNPKADKTNEESPGDIATEGVAHQAVNAFELLGIDLQELGGAGIQRAVGGDMEGIAGKTIMPSIMPDSQGGFLARLIHAIFIKNREITDHTQDLTGGAPIEGAPIDGSFSGGDFVSMAGSASNYPDYPMVDFGTGNFSALSNLPMPLPMDAPVMPVGRGGAELA